MKRTAASTIVSVARRPTSTVASRGRIPAYGVYAVAEIHGNGRRFLIDAIDDESRDELIAGMAVQEQKPSESMMDQTLGRFEIHLLDGLGRQCDRAREVHMVG